MVAASSSPQRLAICGGVARQAGAQEQTGDVEPGNAGISARKLRLIELNWPRA